MQFKHENEISFCCLFQILQTTILTQKDDQQR